MRLVHGAESRPSPPYPADTRAHGWRFFVDVARAVNSTTFTMAPDAVRPWLWHTWISSWQQVPAGSLPAEDEVLIAILRIDPAFYAAYRSTLLRGWVQHSDGRLYHKVISGQVLAMLRERAKWRKSKTKARQATESTDVHEDSAGSPSGVHRVGVGVGVGVGVKPVGCDVESIGEVGSDRFALAPPTPEVKEKVKRATRLQEDWTLPEAWLLWAKQISGKGDQVIVRCSVRFKDHFLAAPGQKGVKQSWQATWRNWVREDISRGKLV